MPSHLHRPDEPGAEAKGVGRKRGGAKRVQSHNRQSQRSQNQTSGMGSMGALLQQAMKKK